MMCRRFDFGVKQLAGGMWVVRLTVNTTSLDSWTFNDYYVRGEVRHLADRLEAKRRNRITRQNRPTAIRVLQQYKSGSSKVRALDFEDYELAMDHAKLSPERQIALGVQKLEMRRVQERGNWRPDQPTPVNSRHSNYTGRSQWHNH